jgi:L,D-transpeptidase YcbB
VRSSSRAALALIWGAAIASMLIGAPLRAAEPDGPAALIGPTEAVAISIQARLGGRAGETKPGQDALAQYYAAPEPHLLWVGEKGLNDRAKAVMEEIGKADDYGLRASDYSLPKLDAFDPNAANAVATLADVELKLSLAVLRYARDARGGRLDPEKIDENLDPTLALPDPLQLLDSIAIRADPAAYLRSFQPGGRQFEALRQALIEARGGKASDNDTDNAARIPDGPALKLGVDNEQVALLRKRLEVPVKAAEGGKETVFDPALDEAVKRFQDSKGVAPDGVVGPGTRRLLNGQQREHAANPARVRQILLNMERWRWLPSDLGPFYVTVNIPEFILRVMDEGKPAFTTRVVVGKPDKQTPIFSNEMQEIVFNPYWNVPTSIKTDELLPTIRGGGGEWFSGGWDTGVFERNGLRINIGGREVDPAAIDWSRVDIRSLNIYQPPGPDNVLGTVKFLFPNKHDVYMHDTTQKALFAQTVRAESHGCMRVQYPDQLASILLKEDQGWTPGNVASAIQNGEDQHIALKQRIPVYITYFTLWVNDDGSFSNFNDIYGHDARMAAALLGEAVAYEQPPVMDDMPVSRMPSDHGPPQRRRGRGPSNSIADSIANFINSQ